MFPLRDENPTELIPLVTFLIILVNVGVWLFVQGAGAGPLFLSSLCEYGAIPGEVTGAIPAGTEVALGPGASCRTGGAQARKPPHFHVHAWWLDASYRKYALLMDLWQ